jgi:hypothetical protein
VEEFLAAEEEVAGVALGVEADHVVAEQPAEQFVAHRRWEDAPRVGVRPGDVHEVVQDDVGTAAPHLGREQVEVVVVQHHDGVAAGRFDLLGHDLGEVTVHGGVAVLEGVDLPPGDVRRRLQVVEVVLHEPQQRVGDDGVEVVLGAGIEGHEANPEIVVAEFGRVDPFG